MPVKAVFIGDDRGERIGFIADNLKYERDIGRKTILIADELTLGLVEEADILSPGYAGDCPADFALEVMCAVKKTDRGAEILSRILVSDEEIRNTKEPFWERCARRVIESVAKTAARAEAYTRKRTRPPHMSLSARMGKILSEAAEKKYSKSTSTLWWERYDDGAVKNLIFDNAQNTAAGIISVTQSYLDVLCRISASERVPLLKDDRPIVIYAPAYSEDELKILLSLLELRFKDAVLLVPEAHEHLLAGTNFETVCSSALPMEGKTIFFGRQSATAFFQKKVYETTGFERLVNLEYETPDALPPGKALVLSGTRWDTAEISIVMPPERRPKFEAEEEDDTIKDLLSAVPKEAKEHETEQEEFITEEDFERFGIELLTDDFEINLLDDAEDDE
jgi:hypothetical protein